MRMEEGTRYVKSRDKTPLTCCEVCIKNEREGRIETERERKRERRGGVASLTILEQCLGSVSFPSPDRARTREAGRGGGEGRGGVIFFTGTLARDRRDSIDLREKLPFEGSGGGVFGQPLTLSNPPPPLRNGFRNRIRIPLPARPVRHPTDIPCTFELEREREIPKEETGEGDCNFSPPPRILYCSLAQRNPLCDRKLGSGRYPLGNIALPSPPCCVSKFSFLSSPCL